METLYLSSWINFGKYRNNPQNLETIINTSEGRRWLKWLMANTYNFKFDHTVVERLNLKEENARCVLSKV